MRSLSSTFSFRAPPQLPSDHQLPQRPAATHTLAKSRSLSLFAKAPKTPLETTPPLPFLPSTSTSTSGGRRPDLTPASSASSDGSSSLRTPEDEGLMAFPSKDKDRNEDRRKWPAWLSWKKSADRESVSQTLKSQAEHERVPPHRSNARALGLSLAHALPRSSGSPRRSVEDTDESEVDSDEEEDGYDDAPTTKPTRASLTQAQSNVRALLRNALLASPGNAPSPPPLVDGAAQTFPRSSAPLHACPRSLSLRETLHTRRLLQRLDRRVLTHSEQRSLIPFTNRSTKPQKRPRLPSSLGIERTRSFDYESVAAVADTPMRVGRFSRGLRRWAKRPTFEQRFQVWTPDAHGAFVSTSVKGVDRPIALCDLEFSEWVEELAGLALDNRAFEKAIAHSFNPLPRKHSPPRTSPRRVPSTFHSSPSPLRVERAMPAEPVVSPVSPTTSSSKLEMPLSLPALEADLANTLASNSNMPLDFESKAPPASPANPAISARAHADKRGSATNSATATDLTGNGIEDEDNTPLEYLSYAIQAKKRKEEKERFLAIEREKREKARMLQEAAEAKRRVEAERLRFEEESRKAEEERKQLEAERRAREERKKEILAEEVAAARRRRESARLGSENYVNIREAHATREMEERRQETSYSRAKYDVSVSGGGRRASGYFGLGQSESLSPVERNANAPAPPPTLKATNTSENLEKNERRRSVVPASPSPSISNKPSLNPEPVRPPNTRRMSMPKVLEQDEPARRPSSVVSATSSVHTNTNTNTNNHNHRQSLIRSQSAPMMPMPFGMNPMQNPMIPVPPMPPMPVWATAAAGVTNVGAGAMGMPTSNLNLSPLPPMPPLPPLMMPNAPFMQSHSNRGASPSPLGSRSGAGTPPTHERSSSRSRERSREHRDRDLSVSASASASLSVSGRRHSVAVQPPPPRSRSSVYLQAQSQSGSGNLTAAPSASASASGSNVNLNRSMPYLASSRSPAKRTSTLSPLAPSPSPSPATASAAQLGLGSRSRVSLHGDGASTSNSTSKQQTNRRRSVYGHQWPENLAGGSTPNLAPAPQTKRRSTMI